MELLVIEQGREVLRGVGQWALDAQAESEVGVAEVTGADGVPAGGPSGGMPGRW